MSSVSLTNEYLQVLVCAGGLAFSPAGSQSGPDTIRLELPGTMRGEATIVECADERRGKGRRLVLQHGDRVTTATIHDRDPFVYLESHVENASGEPVTFDQIRVADLVVVDREL